MEPLSKQSYLKALSDYFHKTRGYVSTSILHKIETEVTEIERYQLNNRPLQKHEVVIRAVMNALAQIFGTMVYCAIAIYVLQEAFHLTIGFEIKNIILLSLLLLGYKVKFRLFTNG